MLIHDFLFNSEVSLYVCFFRQLHGSKYRRIIIIFESDFDFDFSDCCPHFYGDMLKTQRFGRYILQPSSDTPCLSEYRDDSIWEIIFKIWLLFKQDVQELIKILFK